MRLISIAALLSLYQMQGKAEINKIGPMINPSNQLNPEPEPLEGLGDGDGFGDGFGDGAGFGDGFGEGFGEGEGLTI